MPRPDLHILGGSIKHLPPPQWQERMLFAGVPDSDLKNHTKHFPATLRADKTTHPVYILTVGLSGHLVCPCSTKSFNRRQRYIKKGCQLEISNRVTDKKSFLVEKYTFTVPLDGRFSRKLLFMGIVPQSCLSEKVEQT